MDSSLSSWSCHFLCWCTFINFVVAFTLNVHVPRWYICGSLEFLEFVSCTCSWPVIPAMTLQWGLLHCYRLWPRVVTWGGGDLIGLVAVWVSWLVLWVCQEWQQLEVVVNSVCAGSQWGPGHAGLPCIPRFSLASHSQMSQLLELDYSSACLWENSILNLCKTTFSFTKPHGFGGPVHLLAGWTVGLHGHHPLCTPFP